MHTDKKHAIAVLCIAVLTVPVQAKAIAEINETTRIVYAYGLKKSTNLYTIRPDGKKVLFQLGGITKKSKIKSDIYIMNIDGTGLHNLTNSPVHDKVPVFSPDGTHITFQSYRDGNFELYSMRVDGSEQMRLTKNPAKDKRSTWAPDGSLICYQDFRKGHWELFTMKPDGSDVRQITNSDTDSKHPNWSNFLQQRHTGKKQ